jgi:hypothetical protein
MLRPIATGKSFTHTIVAADFDNDGDLDIFLGQNVGPQWIFENSDGRGTFTQHMIAADSRGHEARVGDVDCDGDLDIVGKPWGQQNEGGEAARPPRDHIYLRNLSSIAAGAPLRCAARASRALAGVPAAGLPAALSLRTPPELRPSAQLPQERIAPDAVVDRAQHPFQPAPGHDRGLPSAAATSRTTTPST